MHFSFILYFLKLDQLTHGMKSVQLDDEDASKYFINYISDDSDVLGEDDNHNQIQDDSDDIDVSSLPNSLIVTLMPQELFTNQQMKVRLWFSNLLIVIDLSKG
jgi:hypothetical protein